jgi:hypothetical protein
MSEKIRNLQAEAATAGLNINSKKTKDLRKNLKMTANASVKRIKQFTYLGSFLTVEGALRGVTTRITKANGIFVELCPVWGE